SQTVYLTFDYCSSCISSFLRSRLYFLLLYFSSNSFASKFLSMVRGCLQCMQASTRPSILVGFSQDGQTMGTAFVESIPIQKYTIQLRIINNTPSVKNIPISHGMFLVKIPPYMTIKPTNIKLKAKLLILFILLE